MKKDIESLMQEITTLDNPAIYSIELIKHDYSSLWTAYAVLRGGDGKNNYSVKNENPIKALIELKQVLKSTICPHCHKYMGFSEEATK